MVFRRCCVDGCENTQDDEVLHCFPKKDETRVNHWLDCINSETLKSYPKEKLKNLSVCQKHFEKRFVTASLRLRLGAYPTLFTPDEIQNGVPSRPIKDISNQNMQWQPSRHVDHTYCYRGEPTAKRAKFDDCTSSDTCQSPILTELTAFIEQSTSFTFDASSSGCQNLNASKPNIRSPTISRTEGVKLTVMKTPKSSRERLIKKIHNLTPRCARLYKEYNRVKSQASFLKRAKRALKFSKDNSFEEMTKNMNPYAKKVMHMQINLCMKNKKARRFTDSEKLIALSILKQSPKCYRFLQKIFILPSKSTLNRLISKLDIEVGINPMLVEVMKKEVAEWDNNKKFCSILFDEMHLNEGLFYNQKKDEVEGLVQLEDKENEFADEALVFMLRGAICKWQQPFAFYFCKGTTRPTVLKNILKKIVAATIEIGLSPVATICDQGTAFRRALQDMQQETRREQLLADLPTDETIIVNGKKLSVIYDPSHLIKGLRNNFLNKNIYTGGDISRWQDIVDVYLTDCNHAETRLLYKLNDQHVIPEKIKNRKKMKVSGAARVFSATVSAALLYTAQFSHYADGRPVSETMKNTAKTVKFFDELFDSMNGVSLHHKHVKGKKLRTAVTSTTKHHNFWKEAIQTLEKIEFKDDKGSIVSVPTIKGCITTLKSLLRLWQFFHDSGLKVMRPRYFNSDPIENFFGQVRSYNFRNNDPDCHSFIYTFRSLLITRLITFHNQSFNCEDDQADQLLNMAQILKLKFVKSGVPMKSLENQPEPSQLDHSPNAGDENDTVNEARKQRLEVHSRTYTAGWVVRKILQRTPCDQCKEKLISKKQLPIHNWASHREFNEFNSKLTYPSEMAVRCFSRAMEETNSILDIDPRQRNISIVILNTIKNEYDVDLMCPKHQTDLFFKIVIKFAVNNWCNIINKILRGTDIIRLEMRSTLPIMQQKALQKYKKKLKNKSF